MFDAAHLRNMQDMPDYIIDTGVTFSAKLRRIIVHADHAAALCNGADLRIGKWPFMRADRARIGVRRENRVLHYGKYSDNNDNDIDRLYAEKENLPENVEFVKENGKKSLAQVFTDVRYPKSNNEIFSTKFIEYIIKQGYNL